MSCSERRRADDHRAGRVQQRRRAAGQSDCDQTAADVRVRRRLRPRHPFVARRLADRRPVVQRRPAASTRSAPTPSAAWPTTGGRAGALHARARQSARSTTSTCRARFYFQDDIRVRKGLTLSPGVRYSVQKRRRRLRRVRAALRLHLGADRRRQDDAARAARGSSTASCRRSRSSRRCGWTASGSARSSSSTRRIPIRASATGFTPPTNKYLIGDFKLERNYRYSAGIDQAISPRVRASTCSTTTSTCSSSRAAAT